MANHRGTAIDGAGPRDVPSAPVASSTIGEEANADQIRNERAAVRKEVEAMLDGSIAWAIAHREEADFWRGWHFFITVVSVASGIAALILTTSGYIAAALAAFVGTAVAAFASTAGAERREAEHGESCISNMLLADEIGDFLSVGLADADLTSIHTRLDALLRHRDAVVLRSPLRAAHRTEYRLHPPWGILPLEWPKPPIRHGMRLYFGRAPKRWPRPPSAPTPLS